MKPWFSRLRLNPCRLSGFIRKIPPPGIRLRPRSHRFARAISLFLVRRFRGSSVAALGFGFECRLLRPHIGICLLLRLQLLLLLLDHLHLDAPVILDALAAVGARGALVVVLQLGLLLLGEHAIGDLNGLPLLLGRLPYLRYHLVEVLPNGLHARLQLPH